MVFNVDNEESDKEQEDKKTVKEENDATDESGSQWGLTPLMIEVAKNTITPLREIYDWAITEFLYYCSYLIEDNRKRIADMKKIAKSH